jgi:hypothetical protein
MTALMNGLLWFAMFAIPMLIAVILRRLGRKYYTPGDPLRSPTTEGGHESLVNQRHGDDHQDHEEEGPVAAFDRRGSEGLASYWQRLQADS